MSTPPSSSRNDRSRRGPRPEGQRPGAPSGNGRAASSNSGRPASSGHGRPASSGRGRSASTSNVRPASTGTTRPAPRPAPGAFPPRAEAPTGPGSFAALGVPASLCETLAAQGLVEAFPIQTATLPDALAGRDVLGQGRTGSGKTLAFALPIVARLAANRRAQNDRRPRALVLVPTRELAAQVEAVIKPLAAAARLRSATIFGGVGAGPQIAALRAGTEIIIGCPGRLVDHMGTRALDLSGIEITVLDEADHMADVGFLPMVRRLLDATPQRGQRMLFSATLAGGVDQVVRQYMDDPVTHAVATEAPIEMTHHVLVIHPDERLNVLAELARAHRSVVFTRTKHRAKQLRQKLAAGGLNVVELHGNLSQNARTANLDAFSDGSANVLVATDIAARGIHVDEVPLVVHADPPMEHKAYVHRSGRTARAGAAGTVVTIATHDQVHEVRTLLRQANITATWSRLQANAPGALAAIDGRGLTFDAAGSGRTASGRETSSRPPSGRQNPSRQTTARPAGRTEPPRRSAGRPAGAAARPARAERTDHNGATPSSARPVSGRQRNPRRG